MMPRLQPSSQADLVEEKVYTELENLEAHFFKKTSCLLSLSSLKQPFRSCPLLVLKDPPASD